MAEKFEIPERSILIYIIEECLRDYDLAGGREAVAEHILEAVENHLRKYNPSRNG